VYINTVLRPVAFPFFNRHCHRGRGILQDDGARPHTANVTSNSIAQKGIDVQDWPALSLDMSSIEHLLDMLKRRVYALANPGGGGRTRRPPPNGRGPMIFLCAKR